MLDKTFPENILILLSPINTCPENKMCCELNLKKWIGDSIQEEGSSDE